MLLLLLLLQLPNGNKRGQFHIEKLIFRAGPNSLFCAGFSIQDFCVRCELIDNQKQFTREISTLFFDKLPIKRLSLKCCVRFLSIHENQWDPKCIEFIDETNFLHFKRCGPVQEAQRTRTTKNPIKTVRNELSDSWKSGILMTFLISIFIAIVIQLSTRLSTGLTLGNYE